MNELELTPTRDLITELLRRSDISAIVMRQDRTENASSFILSYGGPILGVVGLLTLAQSRILDCHKEGISDSSVESVALDYDQAGDYDEEDNEEEEEFDFLDEDDDEFEDTRGDRPR